jgi:hypothetical protein
MPSKARLTKKPPAIGGISICALEAAPLTARAPTRARPNTSWRGTSCRAQDWPYGNSPSTGPEKSAHERLVDNPPWLFIVHDLNPRAMSRKIKGFVSAQSWFLDLTLVSMQ